MEISVSRLCGTWALPRPCAPSSTSPHEVQEKKLCLALNRIDGRWDTDKLGDLLRDDDVLEWETGFDEAEVRLYRQLEDAQEPDADDDAEDLDDLEDEDQEEPEGDDEEEDAPEEGTINTTVIRIGPLFLQGRVFRLQAPGGHHHGRRHLLRAGHRGGDQEEAAGK